jgi:hypothetical protein
LDSKEDNTRMTIDIPIFINITIGSERGTGVQADVHSSWFIAVKLNVQ